MTVGTRTDPRYDLEAEEAVLGAMTYSAVALRAAMLNLDSSDLIGDGHAAIFDGLVALCARTGVADLPSLVRELERAGTLGRAGGRQRLLEINAAGAFANVELYVARIIEAAGRRRMMALASMASELAKDVTADHADSVDRIRAAAGELVLPAQYVEPAEEATVFAAVDTPPDWLLKNLVERQDRVLITAEEGLGKSMLLRQLAIMAAAGLHPFNLYRIPPVRALILDFESAPNLVRRKIRPLLESAEATAGFDPGNVRIDVRPRGIDLTKRGDVAWFLGRIAASKPDLICMGPLYKMYVGDMNEESTARRVADVLDEARERFDVAFVIETHAPHASGGRRSYRPVGSSLWLRWPELGIALTVAGQGWELTHWRRPRDDRGWPRKLRHGTPWPWESVIV